VQPKGQIQVVLLVLILVGIICVAGANAFGDAYTETTLPGVYAEATLAIQATQTALPFQATQMAEDNRHTTESNANTEAWQVLLLTGGKVILGGGIILAVFWTIAGSFQAGASALQAAKQAELPGTVDLGDGYRMLNDGEQLRILDVHTGASWPLGQDRPALPERAAFARAQLMTEAMVEIARTTGESAPADWLGGILQLGGQGEE